MPMSTQGEAFPLFFRATQSFEGQREEIRVEAAVEREMQRLEPTLAGRLAPGARVAVAVGSRGVSNLR